MNPPIIFEDAHMLAINKPAGVTVNKSDTTIHEETIQDWSQQYIGLPDAPARKEEVLDDEGEKVYDYQQQFLERGGIVHRIDKETSGILLIAKTKEAFEALQKQFRERTIKKTYSTLTHGKVTPAEGEINIPVGRLPWNRRQFGVVAGGREALTKYHVVKYVELKTGKQKEILSLLEVNPETGRTHQIRVHMKYLNHPIFADFLYAGRKTSRDDRKLLERVFLHAQAITFTHPSTHETVSLSAPLPSELQKVIDSTQDIATNDVK